MSMYPAVLSEHFSTCNSRVCGTLAPLGLDEIWRIYLSDTEKVWLCYTSHTHGHSLAWRLIRTGWSEFMLANSLSSKKRWLASNSKLVTTDPALHLLTCQNDMAQSIPEMGTVLWLVLTLDCAEELFGRVLVDPLQKYAKKHIDMYIPVVAVDLIARMLLGGFYTALKSQTEIQPLPCQA